MKKITTQAQAMAHVKSVLTEKEFKNLCDAANIANGKEISCGFSISQARDLYNEVRGKLAFLMCHDDDFVRNTAKRIMKAADKNAHKGMFKHEGKEIFLID